MAIHSTHQDKQYWLVNCKEFTIEHIKNRIWVYMGERDGLFDTFAEAQSHLLNILKADHAQAIADIERLSAELKVIEAKINTIHLSKKK